MKKVLIVGSVLVVLALVAGVAGVVYAQRGTLPVNGTQTTGYGSGMMGGNGHGMMGGRAAQAAQSTQTPNGAQTGGYGYGMMGGRGMMANGGYGPMHEYMVSALAAQIGMTSEELQAQIDAGKTPYQILTNQGKTATEIQTIMQAAQDEALQQAVMAGAITQTQADWMDSHMEQMWQNGFGPGTGGCMGGGRWQNTNQSNTTNQ